MKRHDFQNEAVSFDNLAREILLKKNRDYANHDALSNFKILAELHRLLKVDMTRPEGVAIHDVLLKLVRLCNLLFEKQDAPENESIKDSFLDAHNYIKMAYLCCLEQSK